MATGKTIAFVIIGAVLAGIGIWLLVSWNDLSGLLDGYNAGLALCNGNATCIEVIQALYGGRDIALMSMVYLIGGIACLVVGAIFIILGLKS